MLLLVKGESNPTRLTLPYMELFNKLTKVVSLFWKELSYPKI